MQTYGEKVVENLLKALPPREYFWYAEPTITNVEHSSRSNPDFIVVAALLGVIVLEVKDWVQIKSATQREITIQRRDGSTDVSKNPVLIAREYARNLADKFQKRSDLVEQTGFHAGKLKFPWRFAVALPNISIKTVHLGEEKGIWDKGQVLGKEDLTPENFQKALHLIPGGFKLERSMDNNILDIIRGVIDPTLVIEDTTGNDIGTLTRLQEDEVRRPVIITTPPKPKPLPLLDTQLPDEAESLVENLTVRLVRGVAGSGKSLVLARRAQHIVELHPELKVLVMTFNVDLAADLRKRIGSEIEVTNFHKICSRVIGKKWRSPTDAKHWLKNQRMPLIAELGLSTDFIAEEIAYRNSLDVYNGDEYLSMRRSGRGQRLPENKRAGINQIFDQYLQQQQHHNFVDWEDVPRLALSYLQPNHPDWQSYDVILIDEAQDFAPSWCKVVKALLKPGGSLFMCDDPTQSIFRYTSWKQKGIEVSGRARTLRVPFRSTRAITEAAHSLIAIDPLLSQSGDVTQPDLTTYQLPLGDKPQLVNCLSIDTEVQFINQKVEELLAAKIPADRIAVLCYSKSLTDRWQALRKKGVYVESFWKMKGLEFQAVLIPELQGAFTEVEYELDEPTISEIRRRLFTAMTRARQNLFMSYSGNFPSELAALNPHVQISQYAG